MAACQTSRRWRGCAQWTGTLSFSAPAGAPSCPRSRASARSRWAGARGGAARVVAGSPRRSRTSLPPRGPWTLHPTLPRVPCPNPPPPLPPLCPPKERRRPRGRAHQRAAQPQRLGRAQDDRRGPGGWVGGGPLGARAAAAAPEPGEAGAVAAPRMAGQPRGPALAPAASRPPAFAPRPAPTRLIFLKDSLFFFTPPPPPTPPPKR
jgi:hypothetical protein